MDPRLQSLHLESVPRREQFRKARRQLENAGGMCTMAGDDLRPAEKALQAAPGWLLDEGKLIPLRIGLNSIGRLPDNDIVVDDATVSRRHCAVLVHSSGSCELHELASKNGTILNGKKISGPTPLNDGDEIRLCDRTLVFVINAAAVTMDPRPAQPPQISPSSSDERTMIT